MTTIEDAIRSVFISNALRINNKTATDLQKKHAGYTPIKQAHLLIDVNECLKALQKIGRPVTKAEINMKQLARCLAKMKKQGKIERLLWFSPSSKNLWVLK